MQRRVFYFTFLLFSFLSLQAKPFVEYSNQSTSAGPGYHKKMPANNYISSNGAEKIIELILKTIGLRAEFEVRKANVPNAAAVVYQGKRYILYNPTFISAMNKVAGTPWASVAILAHEIGHHLKGHTLDGTGSQPAIELEADEFSGFVLRKMGASLSDAQVAMKIIATTRSTKTHPGRNDRLVAIANGWYRADDQTRENFAGKQLSPERKEPSSKVLAEENIAYDVHFTSDPYTEYHVTIKNNLVRLFNNQLQVLGKLWSTGKSSYPLAFQTGPDDFLLISSKGQIFNKQGRVLGYIVQHDK